MGGGGGGGSDGEKLQNLLRHLIVKKLSNGLFCLVLSECMQLEVK